MKLEHPYEYDCINCWEIYVLGDKCYFSNCLSALDGSMEVKETMNWFFGVSLQFSGLWAGKRRQWLWQRCRSAWRPAWSPGAPHWFFQWCTGLVVKFLWPFSKTCRTARKSWLPSDYSSRWPCSSCSGPRWCLCPRPRKDQELLDCSVF